MHPFDPWRAARLLVEQHRLGADPHAAMRIDELWVLGVAMGAIVWRQVLDALHRTDQPSGEALR